MPKKPEKPKAITYEWTAYSIEGEEQVKAILPPEITMDQEIHLAQALRKLEISNLSDLADLDINHLVGLFGKKDILAEALRAVLIFDGTDEHLLAIPASIQMEVFSNFFTWNASLIRALSNSVMIKDMNLEADADPAESPQSKSSTSPSTQG